MSSGPIPWTDIILFAQYAELDRDMSDAFVQIIRAMDAVWIKWAGKKAEDA